MVAQYARALLFRDVEVVWAASGAAAMFYGAVEWGPPRALLVAMIGGIGGSD